MYGINVNHPRHVAHLAEGAHCLRLPLFSPFQSLRLPRERLLCRLAHGPLQ